MLNLARILKLVFKDMSSSVVLSGAVNANSITQEEFVQNAFSGAVHYSENELRNMWHAYSRIREVDGIQAFNSSGDERGISVFDIVFHYVNNNLVLYNNEILCRYQNLLDWRELTMNISEDLLTCAFWARTVPESTMKKIGFGWPIVIGHNNHDLNQILQRGMAENHFHLYGSAPIFHLSWISIMNHVDKDSMVVRVLKNFDKNQRMFHPHFYRYEQKRSLVAQYRQAAYIRLLLLSGIMDRPFSIGFYKEDEELTDEIKDSQMTSEQYEKLRICHWNRTVRNVKEIVQNYDMLEEYLPELSSIIDSFSNDMESTSIQDVLQIDYALLALKGTTKWDDETLAFAGERYFLYAMLERIWRGDPMIDHNTCNLFYAYLIIRENIREELIQLNNKVGFENFKVYESRKGNLILDPVLNKWKARYAVGQSLLYHNIQSLEIRISPGKSWIENRDYCQELDRIIAGNDSKKKGKIFLLYSFYQRNGRYILSGWSIYSL